MGELSPEEKERYARHIIMREVGEEGQKKLKASCVTVIGAGGLGSPVLMYLAAAGVGTIRIIDGDKVDESNLQRQIIHGTGWVGEWKVESAARRLKDLNPFIEVETFRERFDEKTPDSIILGSNVLIDAVDNFESRYIINKASLRTGVPLVHGAVGRLEGQLSVFNYKGGPCYRCLYPEAPPSGVIKSGADEGILGVLPGVIGTMQATEAIKIILNIGRVASGKVVIYDSMGLDTRSFSIAKKTQCSECSG